MNTDPNAVHVHKLEGLVVIIDETDANAHTEASPDACAEGDVTVRGDELETAEKLQKVAEVLEKAHHEEEANLVKEHVRDIVAKQLNEFDGFDR